MSERPPEPERRRERSRRTRHFLWLLVGNLAASLVLSVPLWLLTTTAIALPFVAIVVFMSVILAGYFAFIRLQ